MTPSADSGSPRSPEAKALINLVSKIDEVLAHPSYQATWVMAHVHGHRYSGPSFAAELESARAALAALVEADPPSREGQAPAALAELLKEWERVRTFAKSNLERAERRDNAMMYARFAGELAVLDECIKGLAALSASPRVGERQERTEAQCQHGHRLWTSGCVSCELLHRHSALTPKPLPDPPKEQP